MTAPAPFVLDVRPLLARGDEPFGAIMEAADALLPGQALCLLAPFRPVPLFGVMVNRGFTVVDRHLPAGDWEVTFTPSADAAAAAHLAPGSSAGAAFWPDPAEVLDLTGLMPPEPMQCILEVLERMAPGSVLFAVLDREPMFLFPELAMRGHEWAGNAGADGASYRMMIRRGGADV